jgi:hypothetical protein
MRARVLRPSVGLVSCLMAMILAITVMPAAAADCDPAALGIVRNFLEARDAQEYRRAQRYLSDDFGQHFRDTYGAAYLDYLGDPDVTWRQSAIQGSAVAGSQCTVSVASIREAQGVSGAVAETYTLVVTYRGWRIDRWQWRGP